MRTGGGTWVRQGTATEGSVGTEREWLGTEEISTWSGRRPQLPTLL